MTGARTRRARPDGERGVALPIILVVVIVTGTLGVSVLRGSIIDETLTGNRLGHETTFRAAESAATAALLLPAERIAVLNAATATSAAERDVAVDWRDARVSVDATLSSVGTGLPRGWSTGDGGYCLYRLRARGAATLPGNGARSAVERGAEQLARCR